jgi:DNA-binding NarL/FixJ family response regulator
VGDQAKDAAWRVALVIQNPIRRYGVEGMMRVLLGGRPVRHLDPGAGQQAPEPDGQRLDVVLAASADLRPESTRDAVRELCARGPRLLVLVDGPDALDAPWTADCGAQGFLDWSELEPRTLADAVADVVAGKFHLSSSLARRLVVRAGQGAPAGGASQHGPASPWGPAGAALTPRELQVLRLVAEGLSNKQVSRQLQISEHGVKRLVGNVLAKLNCPNRTLAVVRAMEDGLLAV